MERRGREFFNRIYSTNQILLVSLSYDSLTFSKEIFMERKGRTKLRFENLDHLFFLSPRFPIAFEDPSGLGRLKEAVL